jgi:hypothetical protein
MNAWIMPCVLAKVAALISLWQQSGQGPSAPSLGRFPVCVVSVPSSLQPTHACAMSEMRNKDPAIALQEQLMSQGRTNAKCQMRLIFEIDAAHAPRCSSPSSTSSTSSMSTSAPKSSANLSAAASMGRSCGWPTYLCLRHKTVTRSGRGLTVGMLVLVSTTAALSRCRPG